VVVKRQWQAVILPAARGKRCIASAQLQNMMFDESRPAGMTGFQHRLRRRSKCGGAATITMRF
jgi:hypothetical protein